MLNRLILLVFLSIATAPTLPAVAQGAGADGKPRLPSWTISSAPLIQIGAEGDTTTEFSRIVGVSRMPTGEVVVANAATQELRVFSRNGRYLKRLSRAGDGPGELRFLASIARSGDTLFAMERGIGSRPVSIYLVASGYIGSAPLAADNASRGVSATGRLSDGGLLVVEGTFRSVDPREIPVWRDSVRLGILRIGNPGRVSWIGRFQGASWFSYEPRSIPGRLWMSRYALGADLVSTVSGSRVWFGDSGTGEISIVGADGRIIGRTFIPGARRAFNEASLEREKGRMLSSARDEDESAKYEALFSRARRPGRAPAFKRFVPGLRGEVGVELFAEESRMSRTIIVLDSSGAAVAQFFTPPGLLVYEIGGNYILGVQLDRDGLETVAVYRLERR